MTAASPPAKAIAGPRLPGGAHVIGERSHWKSSFRTIKVLRCNADTPDTGLQQRPEETAMADQTRSQSEFGGEMQLLAGVWALVCVAVLTTAVLV